MNHTNLLFNSSSFPKDNSKLTLIELMEKANFVHQTASGVYSLLPLGKRLQDKLEDLIRRNLPQEFQEMSLSVAQSPSLWEQSKRIDSYGDELMKTNSGFILSPTCEEQVTTLVKSKLNQKKVELSVYQINTKFRNELRPRHGLIRTKEFLMKDGYSFGTSEYIDSMYAKLRQAYCNIFDTLGLDYVVRSADCGEVGGLKSEEFLVKTNLGEDVIDGVSYLEVAHIFDLGTKYTDIFGFVDNNNNIVSSACYGIGISRLLMAVLETRRTENGFWGDYYFNTFNQVYIETKGNTIPLGDDVNLFQSTILVDDRNVSFGIKMFDAELICVSKILIFGNKNAGRIEVIDVKTKTKSLY